MKVKRLHSWQLSVTQALDLQRRLAEQVSRNSEVMVSRLIAGVDIATGKRHGMATGAVVFFSYPEFRVMEAKVVLVDGQGVADPRRFDLASHLGLFFGYTNNRLC